MSRAQAGVRVSRYLGLRAERVLGGAGGGAWPGDALPSARFLSAWYLCRKRRHRVSRFLDREPVTGREALEIREGREGLPPEPVGSPRRQHALRSRRERVPPATLHLRSARAGLGSHGPGVRFACVSPETHPLSAPAEVLSTQLPPRVWATSSRVFGKCIRAEYPKNDLECAPVFVNTATSPQHGRIVCI